MSKILVHPDTAGTGVDYVEYSVMETGGSIAGLSVSAGVTSGNILITVSATSSVSVKAIKVVMV